MGKRILYDSTATDKGKVLDIINREYIQSGVPARSLSDERVSPQMFQRAVEIHHEQNWEQLRDASRVAGKQRQTMGYLGIEINNRGAFIDAEPFNGEIKKAEFWCNCPTDYRNREVVWVKDDRLYYTLMRDKDDKITYQLKALTKAGFRECLREIQVINEAYLEALRKEGGYEDYQTAAAKFRTDIIYQLRDIQFVNRLFIRRQFAILPKLGRAEYWVNGLPKL